MNQLKGKILLLSAESCGYGDSDLGFEILISLVESLIGREDKPAAVILWNTAVKLIAEGSPLLGPLRRLEEKGTRILAGRSCLAELGIEDKVAVGKSTTMPEILDLILNNDVVSL